MARLALLGLESGTAGSTSATSEYLVNTSTGTFTASTTTVFSGGYALELNGANISIGTKQNYSAVNFFSKCMFRFVALPAANNVILQQTASATGILTLRLNTTGTLTLISGSSAGTVIGTTVATLAVNTWYMIQTQSKVSTTAGFLEVILSSSSGALIEKVSSATNINTGSVNINSCVYGPRSSTQDTFWDDIVEDNASYPPFSRLLARSPITGVPTYDAWTKTGADPYIGDTPMSATNSVTAPSSVSAQTKKVGLFSTTQTGKGTNVIKSNDTIQSTQLTFGAKSSSTTVAPSGNARLRYGGTDKDVAWGITSGTTDNLYAIVLAANPTVAQADAMEVGGSQTATSPNATIEDMWIYLEVIPAFIARQLIVRQAVKRSAYW